MKGTKCVSIPSRQTIIQIRARHRFKYFEYHFQNVQYLQTDRKSTLKKPYPESSSEKKGLTWIPLKPTGNYTYHFDKHKKLSVFLQGCDM